jgi:hypothetical protein
VCYACELELDAHSEGLDTEAIDTTIEKVRRALSILEVCSRFLHVVDDPDESTFQPIQRFQEGVPTQRN